MNKEPKVLFLIENSWKAPEFLLISLNELKLVLIVGGC